ncbi:MAG: TlpA family protein disulfide reductase [Cyclobacteriaceae bacterium]|nr:TlpA family protein disulfide reductase [Cyclobacteriaceae bacterium]
MSLIASVAIAIAQKKYTPIKEGDEMPSISFTFLESSQISKRPIDFKGRVTVLDVWTTSCGWCILTMPKMHDIQRKYGKEVQVILVNDAEDQAKVERLIAKRSNIPRLKISLPVVLGDSLLTKVILKHVEMPTYMVFGKDGRFVKKVFGAENVDRIVDALLHGKPIEDSISVKVQTAQKAIWQSELASGDVNGPTNIMFTPEGGSAISCHRSSIIDLYRFAYGEFFTRPRRELSFVEPMPFNRVIFESERHGNPGKHYYNKVQSDSLYSYKMTAPPNSSWLKMSGAMANDLDNWFGFESRIEKRIVKYVSLTIPDTTIFKTVDGEFSGSLDEAEICFKNFTIQQFLRNWNASLAGEKYYMGRYPIVYESEYKGRIKSMCAEGVDTIDPTAVDKAISKFGIRFQLVERPVDMLVIRDKKMLE